MPFLEKERLCPPPFDAYRTIKNAVFRFSRHAE